MSFFESVMLLGVFSLGSIAVVASAARLSNIGLWADGDDFTYDAAMLPVWGAVEINVAIISGKPGFSRLSSALLWGREERPEGLTFDFIFSDLKFNLV